MSSLSKDVLYAFGLVLCIRTVVVGATRLGPLRKKSWLEYGNSSLHLVWFFSFFPTCLLYRKIVGILYLYGVISFALYLPDKEC